MHPKYGFIPLQSITYVENMDALTECRVHPMHPNHGRRHNPLTNHIQLRELPGCWAGKNQDDLDRNDLVLNGIATMVAQNGAALIEFEATTRRKDQFGDSDTSAEDIQIPAIRSRIRRRLRQATQAAYPRYKLANNGAPIKSGQRIITPDIYAAFLLGQAERLEEDGLIEDLNKFRAGLIVERNASNPNRLDAFITPDAINRARVFALNIQMGG